MTEIFATKVIALVNQKGGVGKTTSSLFIAFALAIMGYRVLLIDLDPQANATLTLLLRLITGFADTICEVMDPKVFRSIREVVKPTSHKNLWLVPGSTWLSTTANDLSKVEGHEFRLRTALEEAKPYFHYIIIDTPPSLETLTINAMVACTHIIIPTSLKIYPLTGIQILLDALALMRKTYQRYGLTFPILGVLINQVRFPYTNNALLRLNQLKEQFGEQTLFQVQVPLNEKVEEANGQEQPGYDFAQDAKGIKAYYEITKELVQRVG